MRSRRGVALTLAAFSVAAAACSSRTALPSAGSPLASGSSPPSGSRNASASSATTRGPGAARPPSTAGTIQSGAVLHYDDDGGVGDMARVYLRAAPATTLRIEIDYVQGRAPQQSALDHLRSVLSTVLDKPGGIDVDIGNPLPASRQTWSVDDMVALERTARREHSTGSVATMWFVYLNGTYAAGSSALGVAFEASSAAIFLDQIRNATTSVVQEPEIERAVLTHEAGHLLALVNIGYRSRYDHEDPNHPHHSKYPSDVMYWQIDDTSIKNVLTGGPPADYDQYDRADLQMLQAGG